LDAGHQDYSQRAEGGDWITRPRTDTVCAMCLAAALVASARKAKLRTRSALDDMKARIALRRLVMKQRKKAGRKEGGQ
jgi:hypothetical protein